MSSAASSRSSSIRNYHRPAFHSTTTPASAPGASDWPKIDLTSITKRAILCQVFWPSEPVAVRACSSCTTPIPNTQRTLSRLASNTPSTPRRQSSIHRM